MGWSRERSSVSWTKALSASSRRHSNTPQAKRWFKSPTLWTSGNRIHPSRWMERRSFTHILVDEAAQRRVPLVSNCHCPKVISQQSKAVSFTKAIVYSTSIHLLLRRGAVCVTSPAIFFRRRSLAEPYSQRIIIRNWTKLNWSKTQQRPSQDKLSGIWGGCSFTFHTFHLRDWNCLRVFLALLLWRKLGFPTKTSFNGHQPFWLV